MTDRDPEPTLMLPEEKEKEDQGDSLPWKAKTIKEKDLNLSYGKVFLPRSKESRRIFSCLEREVKYLPAETSKVFVFGKWHPIPRKQAGYGDEGVTYTYSRVTLAAQTWTPVLRELVSKVRRITGIGYNFVLINRYADGKDCMGEHKDDEKELDPEAPIASMSFGAERDFYFKHQRTRNNKDKSIPKVNLKLEDGSLLLMNEPTNKFWYHALPARKSCRDVRINLTFRKVEMKNTMSRLTRSFFDKPCKELSTALLGKYLCRRLDCGKVVKGRIVETEMYPGQVDKASHSFNDKKTGRNGAMFMEPGTAYVYLIYGMYFCFNISAQETGGCILIRALEPTSEVTHMEAMRNKSRKSKKTSSKKWKPKELCSGPSKLCQAFGITRDNTNTKDLAEEGSEIWLEDADEVPSDNVTVCKRIGIEGSGAEYANLPYRFYEKQNENVSVLDEQDKKSRKRKAS